MTRIYLHYKSHSENTLEVGHIEGCIEVDDKADSQIEESSEGYYSTVCHVITQEIFLLKCWKNSDLGLCLQRS